MARTTTDMDGASAWIAVQTVVQRLVSKGLLEQAEAEALLAEAETKGRHKASREASSTAALFR